MTIEELQDERKRAWKRVKSSHSLLVRSLKLNSSLEKRYCKDEREYERVDRELSMLDGRFERLQAAKDAMTDKPKRKVKTNDLTEEDIRRIAEELGITLDE